MSTPTLGLSLLAGILSFLSPCVLPLLPSYLSFVSGTAVGAIRDGVAPRRLLLLNTLMFVLGFSLVFVALGVLFAGTALLFPGAIRTIDIIAGSIVVVLGLNIIFDFVKVLNLEARLHLSRKPAGLAGSFLVGLAFAAGWTPCIGPILTSILFLAGTSGNVGMGVLYLSVYSAGLAIPFLLTALFFGSATSLFARIKNHFGAIRMVTGLFLVSLGLLIALGRFQELNVWLLRTASVIAQWESAHPQGARLIPAVLLIAIATGSLAPALVRAIRRDQPVLRAGGALAAITLGLVATLQLAGTIDLVGLVSRWLRFQGL
ncbi:MAG: cytochrome c biogenesis protein CcdA [Spirochaetaceae bacterium]|nr:MAG: cytochrome c biogenesis protein CcdA [Spirochaetaceae bacterium]